MAATLRELRNVRAQQADSERDADGEDSLPPVETTGQEGIWSTRILAVVAVVAVLWWAQVVVIPVVLSLLISYWLEPVVVGLESWHIRRMVGAPLVIILLLGVLGVGAYELGAEAAAFVDHVPTAIQRVAHVIQQASRSAPGTVARMREAARELETAASSARSSGPRDGVTQVRVEEPTFKWSDWLVRGSHGVAQLAVQMFAVCCLVYYLLMAGDLYKRRLVRMVPTPADKKVALQILAEIDRQIERVLAARVAISLILGIVIWLVFLALGLEAPGVWGVIAAFLFAIPIAGPTVLVVGAAIAAFVQFGSLSMTAATGGLVILIGALEGNLLTPWLMSRAGEMNPVAVFVSLLFWGWIWGFWGLLLAVPITAAMKVVCERMPGLNSFAEMLKA